MTKPVLVSYPKSGRTWTRIMLDGLGKINDYQFHHGRLKPRFANNRTIDSTCLTDRNVIFLYRNPLDVVVSEFYASKYAATGMGWKGDIDSYIRHQDGKHFRWIVNHHRDSLSILHARFISYENMLENGPQTLEKMFVHWGWEVDTDEIQRVYEECSFENLKDKTNEDFSTKYFLGPPVDELPNRENRKVREGKANNYHKHLNEDQISYLQSILDEYNYADTLSTLRAREL